MKENGWVCETYEEFRKYYIGPQDKKAGYEYEDFFDKKKQVVSEQEEEEYMFGIWNRYKNALVVICGCFFPYMDIRYLYYLNYCDGAYDGERTNPAYLVNSFANICKTLEEYDFEDGTINDFKNWVMEDIASAPNEVLKALIDIQKYYENKNYVKIKVLDGWELEEEAKQRGIVTRILSQKELDRLVQLRRDYEEKIKNEQQ